MHILIFFGVLALCNCQAYFDDTTTQKPWPGPFANNKIGELVQDTPEVAQAKLEHARSFHEALANLPELPPEERYIPGPYEISQRVAQQQIHAGQMQAQQPYTIRQTPQSQVQYLHPQTQYHPAETLYQKPRPEYKIDLRNEEPAANYQEWQYQSGQYQQPQYEQTTKYQSGDYQGNEKLHTQIFYQAPPKPEYVDEQYEYKHPVQPVQYQKDQEYLYKQALGDAAEQFLTAEDVPRSPLGETPEVAQARKEHLEAVEKAKEALKAATWQ